MDVKSHVNVRNKYICISVLKVLITKMQCINQGEQEMEI